MTIKAVASRILDDNPSPAVRFRLLRDVIRCRPDNRELILAKKKLWDCEPVKALAGVQNSDGGWGRFHSASSRDRSPIPTTEFGVNRAIALGLNLDSPILKKVSKHIKSILTGKTGFPDPPEKNDRWETGYQLFAASTLAMIEPNAKAIDKYWNLWLEIAARTFASGVYNEADEIQAHRELTGASVRRSYLVLNSKYHMLLLGARSQEIPAKLQKALAGWVFNHRTGIGYLGQPLFRPPRLKSFPIDAWLSSHEVMSRFGVWKMFAAGTVNWLWSRRNAEGFWDLGTRAKYMGVSYLPLSNDWRSGRNRYHDWSTRILALLARYYIA